MTPLEKLLTIEEIKQLKSRYCRVIDDKRWDELPALFTSDARFDGFGSAPPGATREQFADGVATRLARALSIHQLHVPEIEVLDDDRARGIFPMMDYLEFPTDETPIETPGSLGYVGFGHYEEEYRREAGHWRIAYSRLSRLRLDPLPPGGPARAADRLSLLPDWLVAR